MVEPDIDPATSLGGTAMLVLEATDRTQGHRLTDYHSCRNGELVYLVWQESSNPSCGCTRGFVGLASRKATTTACLSERPDLTVERLAEHTARSLFAGGWLTEIDPSDELVGCVVTEIIEMANNYARFGVGTVIEREGDFLQIRPELRHLPMLTPYE
jgi:hypothetical protein